MQNAAGDGVARAPRRQDDADRVMISLAADRTDDRKGNFAGNIARLPREFHQPSCSATCRPATRLPPHCRHAINLGIACDRGLASVMPQAHRRIWWRVLPTCARPSSAPVEAARAFFVSMEIG